MIERTAIIISGAKYIPGLFSLINEHALREATLAAEKLSHSFTECGMSFDEMRFIIEGLNVLYPSGRGIRRRP